MLEEIEWWRVTLDEAQHIKNPPTKQTAAIRAMKSRHRIALTGTPVENRLTELWSIMEFCCPGYLGTSGDFRRTLRASHRTTSRRTAVEATSRTRPAVHPARRLKTDKNVITDLPPLVQSQADRGHDHRNRLAALRRGGRGDAAQGRRLRGHPKTRTGPRIAREAEADLQPPRALPRIDRCGPRRSRPPNRSGKSTTDSEMLEEVIANGDHALIFSQYRRWGTSWSR